MMFSVLRFGLAVFLFILSRTTSFYQSAFYKSALPDRCCNQQTGVSLKVRSNSIDRPWAITSNYYESLKQKNWIKLICGASNQDVAFIRNLCFIYTLSGVDCIDISADTAVITAAHNGINSALKYNIQHDEIYGTLHKPLLMVSVNDDDDPHFRKAYFNKTLCPSDCLRPCERVCPADAIPPVTDTMYQSSQEANYYEINPATINEIFRDGLADSIEIHTLAGHEEKFRTLITSIDCELFSRAKLIAISFPKINNTIDDTVAYIGKLESILNDAPSYHKYRGLRIWQTDGKPMTGDIGRGSARAAVEFASSFIDHIESDHSTNPTSESLYSLLDQGSHFIQLAGGTNDFSYHYAKEYNLQGKVGFGGFAFGGFARKNINGILEGLEKRRRDILSADDMSGNDTNDSVRERRRGLFVEDYPQDFQQCMDFAVKLVKPVKSITC